MNKKAGILGLTWTQIIGLVIFILAITSVFGLFSAVFGRSVSGSDIDNLDVLFEELESLNETNNEIRVNLQLQQNDAIVVFNPNSDFNFVLDRLKDDLSKRNMLHDIIFKGHSMFRPSSCANRDGTQNSTCVCFCKDLTFIGVRSIGGAGNDFNLDCASRVCRVSEDFILPEKIFVNEIFEEKELETRFGRPNEYDMSDDFWLNSFIILRSELLEPTNKVQASLFLGAPTGDNINIYSAPIVAGYRDFIVPSTFDVTLRFLEEKDNKNVVTFCITGDC